MEGTFYEWHQEAIEAALEPTHLRLVEWGRWGRTKPAYGHCASIEHRYRSPQCWYPPEARPPEPDLWAAVAVEKTMRHLPEDHRKALVFCYVRQMRPEMCWQRLKLRPYLLGERMRRARLMVRNLLFNRATDGIMHSDNSTVPAPAEAIRSIGIAFACEIA